MYVINLCYLKGEKIMSWCPNCRTQYLDGITNCSDCNAKLVDTLVNNEESVSILLAEENIAMELLKFYKYAEIEGAYIKYNEKASLYEVFVPLSYEKKAAKLATIFKQTKKEEQDTESGNNGQKSNSDELKEQGNSRVYIKQEDKYKDVKSSGYVFLIVGMIGTVFMFLNIFGIIDFYLASNIKYLTYIVMFGMFILFIIIGFYSLHSSKKIKEEAKVENDLTNDIMEWFRKNFSGDDVDENADINISDISQEEIRYFKRTEAIKNIITQTYGELDVSYLDKIADDVYQELYD